MVESNYNNLENIYYSDLKKTKKNNKTYKGTPLLLIIQIVVCLIIISLVFLLKNYNSGIYNYVHTWYNEKINDSLIPEDDIEKYKSDINETINFKYNFINNN